MIAEECWGVDHREGEPVALDRAADVHGLEPAETLGSEIHADLEHGDHGGAVLLRQACAVAEVVLVAVGQHDEVDAREPVLVALRELGIAGPERVNQDALAGGLEVAGRMPEPGQLHDGFSHS
jgi:hypothetical protein